MPRTASDICGSNAAQTLASHAPPFFRMARATLRRVDPRLEPRLFVLLGDEVFVLIDDTDHATPRAATPRELCQHLGLPCSWRGSLRDTLLNASLVDGDWQWLSAARALGTQRDCQLHVVVRVVQSPIWARRSLRATHVHGHIVPRSLLEALAGVFTDELVESIETVAAPQHTRHPDPRILIRSAAVRFMASLGTRSFGPQRDFGALFEAIDDVSTLSYERRDARGGLVLARLDHGHVERVLCLAEIVPLDDTRRLRKVLETSGADNDVLVDDHGARGLARVRSTYTGIDEDVFTIGLLGHHHWCVEHHQRRLFEVRSGLLCASSRGVTRSMLRDALTAMSGACVEAHLERLWDYVAVVRDQARGAMLVVHRDAQAEAQRLALDGFRIVPRPLDGSLLRSVTAIDGAVFLSHDGDCVAIGVIVDGVATVSADRTRGARFNSALRYVTAQRGAAIAIVVSDDATVDLVRYDPQRQTAVA